MLRKRRQIVQKHSEINTSYSNNNKNYDNEQLSQLLQDNVQSYQNCSESSFTWSNQEDQFSQNGGKKTYFKMFDSLNEQQECFQILRSITLDFDQSYLKIKNNEALANALLKFQSKKNIQYLIRYWRQKLKREGKSDIPLVNNNPHSKQNFKRMRQQKDPDYIYSSSTKRSKQESQIPNQETSQSLPLTLIKDFHYFDTVQKNKILNALDQILKDDKELFLNAAQQQVNTYQLKTCDLYENHFQKELNQLFSQLSPLAVILLNVEISLINSHYTEEGNALSKNLLPYLNQWDDYSFILPKHLFILTRFLHSLVRHIQDTKMEIQKGFILFTLTLDAQKVHEIMVNEKNEIALVSSLQHLGYSQKASEIFIQNVSKLIWPEVLKYLSGKEEKNILDNLLILSKLKIQNDPGFHLKKLNSIFAQRRLLVDQLLLCEKFDITIEVLCIVLENIKLLNLSSIKQCFDNDSQKWLQVSTQIMNQEKLLGNQVSMEKLIQNVQ